MQATNSTIDELLSKLKLYFQENYLTSKYANEEPPLRAELFNLEQMKQHARELAAFHKLNPKRNPDWLLKRLADNEKVLIKVRGLLTDAVKENNLVSPAGEWLLDNFYLIEEQIRTGKQHLPKGYSEGLPQLENGHSAGLPRVYDIALELIAHSDGHIDIEILNSFIQEYQAVTELQLGELWAIPIMLRLALIENLRRVAARIAIDRINQNLADYWSAQMIETAEKDAKSLILVIADMARSNPPLESSFVAELTRKLLWKGPDLTLPLTWMEQRLSEIGVTSSELVNIDNQKQAADQVSISNSIGSLRFLSSVDWREFVEAMSVVEQVLKTDPACVYTKMDFSSRDRYRHVVENIAKYSDYTEKEVAQNAVQMAEANTETERIDLRKTHVGYYLVGGGTEELKKRAQLKLPLAEAIQERIKKTPLTFYLGSILLITILAATWLFARTYSGQLNTEQVILFIVVLLFSCSQFAVSVINWLSSVMIAPTMMPRLNFLDGISDDNKTIVVIPTMLANAYVAEELAEKLEVHFLANRDDNLFFALLTDFPDAASEKLPEDDRLLQLVERRINDLNSEYKKDRDIFFLLHRPRKWNVVDKVWMGYERKRGKLADLNALIRENATDRFSVIVGDTSFLSGVKYVITLDTDTQLPRGAAWKMVGAMAHPLNYPLRDDAKIRITEGYGILQPRVSTSLPKSETSLYGRLFSGERGIDPYTRLVSDVYQDLFSEGSFIGKGIYDIDAFEWTLKNRFPENRILSHDLLEGCYTRCGLLSDVELYEDYPSRYSKDVNRRHRWIRGDWQIASWIFPFVAGRDRRARKNYLSSLSRWKIFDNLRRSIAPVALTTLLLFTWINFHSPLFWTFTVIGLIILPSLISTIWTIIKKSDDISFKHHVIFSTRTLKNSLIQNAFTFVCLPYEAYFSLHAILRTSWRMMVTHKKLLEWNPSANLESTDDDTIKEAYLSMWIAPVLGLLSGIYLAYHHYMTILLVWPVLALWVISPAVAWWVSHPLPKLKTELTTEQLMFLRRIARKTWAFFETFVGAEDNWLPPDNYQENPGAIVAHRTSPTNIGLSLLANLAAYDFGYLVFSQFIDRTAKTMETMDRMEKCNGHFYNWYDTISLKPLHPLYISAVDSGNLIAHLLTLRQGLLSLTEQKILHPRLFEGIRDTVNVLEHLNSGVSLAEFKSLLARALAAPPATPNACKLSLEELIAHAGKIQDGLANDTTSIAYYWSGSLLQLCNDAYNELKAFMPWLFLSEVPSEFAELLNTNNIPSFNEIKKIAEIQLSASDKNNTPGNDSWQQAAVEAKDNIDRQISIINNLIQKCTEFSDVPYDFLYDKSRHLFTIGYNVSDHRRDAGYYDLLASEARLCSFVAIAQGKIPQDNWFALSRMLTNSDDELVLLSWSGSMFEYLMPNLVMPEYENTLLYQTSKTTIYSQMKYAQQHGVPWGISESGYNMIDASMNYQYRAFGVPDLGLKRGLADDLVIAPYASALGLMITPDESCKNLERMANEGFEGRYGFYEAIDYTKSRLPRGQSHVIVQSFMAHHQGMAFLSFAYLLLDQPMQKRFEAEPQFQATMLLLQERVPKVVASYSYTTDVAEYNPTTISTEMRVVRTPHTVVPEIQLLSNGRYHVMISSAGGGYSRWKNLSVSRWREDVTCDNWGFFCYIRDLDTKEYWSAMHQPAGKETKTYEATFTQGRAEFRRSDNNLDTYTEIIVSPEDDIEIRRVHITNRSRKRRTIELTSYAEVVLNAQPNDVIHRTFSNMFIQTELAKSKHSILCNRRKRSAHDPSPWLFHLMVVHGENIGKASYETDRSKFIGRGNTIINPAALNEDGELSGTYGPVLDPIVAMRYQITIEPEETIVADMILGVSDTREGCMGLIEKYQDKHNRDRVFELAWTHSHVVLRQLNATEEDAQLFGRLAGSVIYNNPLFRADQDTILKNRYDQSKLWSHAISGDIPIVLVQIQDSANIELVKKMIQAHAYWHLKGLVVDLVIWNEDHGGYRQLLQNQILGLVAVGAVAEIADKPGGIFVRAAEQVPNEDRILLQSVARVIVSDSRGSLEDQVKRRSSQKNNIQYLTPVTSKPNRVLSSLPQHEPLLFFNGFGGFTSDGREYVIHTHDNQVTPAPWVNVLANPNFGTIVSESGQAYTWSENAHSMRLTPWNNDAITDSCGEAFYIRDEESGYFWSPAPLPAKGHTPYVSRHGFGYSVFEHSEDGIESELWIYVDIETKIKFSVLKVRNHSGRTRQLSVTGYVEWVMGDFKNKSAMHLITETNQNGAIFVKNPFSIEFSERVAFFDVDYVNRSFTTDRTEFIGRNGSLANPDAMSRVKLSGKTGAALDPCAAIQVPFKIESGQEKEVIFRLGAGKDITEAVATVASYRSSGAAKDVLDRVCNYWQQTLTTIQIETPDPGLNILTNGWLAYQTLSSRLWARSGYYQSGGAYGFRDQLQDVLSMLQTQPAIARNQILLCASRQFIEGDVQHWWHPPMGRGVRTRCSDDYLWLPYVTAKYVSATGDVAILEEHVPFLEGRPLNLDEESYYDLPIQSIQTATIYDHCVKAIQHGLRFGAHGLPLMGSGDWNDGMDKVGREGRGESVWLAFFLYDVLNRFVNIADERNDAEFAELCRNQAQQLQEKIEQNAWDGNWYRRAYFDNGTPLGSEKNEECKIDSIAQSWSVLTNGADKERAKTALSNADQMLVDKKLDLIQLLDPPFDKSNLDPGYIKGYLPGIRENGGQYTHAAVWMIMAQAALGNAERAWQLMNMVNPLHHANTAEKIAVYKVEPYVVAADVYAVTPHGGRGGWTWYTGSAGWMYQLIIEWLIGIRSEGNRLRVTPCLPQDWKSCTINYRYQETMYQITISQKAEWKEKMRIVVDGRDEQDNSIPLVNDKNSHKVEINM